MIALLTFVHVIVCVFLILVVLLQQGKSQDFSSTFGGGGSQSSFGSRSGATLLTKATAVMAILFMVTSMTLTIMMTNRGSTSVIDESTIPSSVTPAATPGAEDTAAPANTEAPGAGAGADAVPDDATDGEVGAPEAGDEN